MFEYEDIKKLAREVGCKVTDLTVLASGNDPFYAGVPYRRERAEWFAELWDRFGFQHGVHLRRIHYVLVSQLHRECPSLAKCRPQAARF